MNDETLNLEQAAAFLFIHENTMQELAAKGEIPNAAKIGRAWVFLKSGLIDYVKNQSAIQNKLRKAGQVGGGVPASNDDGYATQRTRGRRGPRKPLPVLPAA